MIVEKKGKYEVDDMPVGELLLKLLMQLTVINIRVTGSNRYEKLAAIGYLSVHM